MDKDEKIGSRIDDSLNSNESKTQFLSILDERISSNRKLMSRLFTMLIITGFAFPLLIEAKISEISFGPLKIIDKQIIIGLIPTIFSFTYYKYISVWLDLVEQKNTFKNLTSKLFNIEIDSFLNQRLKQFSVLDSLMKYHQQDKMDKIGCLSYILWIPAALILIFFPFSFEFYMTKHLYYSLDQKNLIDWSLVILPIALFLFTILTIVQAFRKESEEK